MTTKVTIENHGPEIVKVQRNGTDLAILKPQEHSGEHVWQGGGSLTIIEGETTPRSDKRNYAYSVIDSERDYQEMRIVRDGSTAVGEHHHSPEEFLLYIEHYAGEARRVASTTWGPDANPATMDVIRKIGALAVAAIEHNGAPRREGF